MKAVVAALIAIAAAAPAAGGSRPERDISGMWINPHDSVAVRTGRCGDRLCGWIAWVNAEAAKDARDSGIADPVGTEVLRDYRPSGDGRWRGTVFVLDMGRTFSSSIETIGDRQLRISGCLVGGFLCKSQIWHRP